MKTIIKIIALISFKELNLKNDIIELEDEFYSLCLYNCTKRNIQIDDLTEIEYDYFSDYFFTKIKKMKKETVKNLLDKEQEKNFLQVLNKCLQIISDVQDDASLRNSKPDFKLNADSDEIISYNKEMSLEQFKYYQDSLFELYQNLELHFFRKTSNK